MKGVCLNHCSNNYDGSMAVISSESFLLYKLYMVMVKKYINNMEKYKVNSQNSAYWMLILAGLGQWTSALGGRTWERCMQAKRGKEVSQEAMAQMWQYMFKCLVWSLMQCKLLLWKKLHLDPGDGDVLETCKGREEVKPKNEEREV